MKPIFTITALVAFSLSACTESGLIDKNPSDPFSENFGNSTYINKGALNGDLQREMAMELTRKFASETPATINFAFNSSKLDATAQNALNQQAAWIKAHPNITFKVFGHTDKVGSNSYNKSLGLRRAKTAVNYLVRQGIDRRKLRAIASIGEERPLVLTEERNAENRRTVTEVEGFYQPGQDFIDGRYAVKVYQNYAGAFQEVTVNAGGTE